MASAKTLLRWSAIACLTNGGLNDATIAGGRVFDSRLDSLDVIAAEEKQPLIMVYTPGSVFRFIDDGNSSRIVPDETLLIEISLSKFEENKENVDHLIPETDAELELVLDHFETQVFTALLNGATTWSQLFHNTARQMLSVESNPVMSPKGDIRLAARQIVFECRPCQPEFESTTVDALAAADDPTGLKMGTGIAPYLESFFTAVRENATGDFLAKINQAEDMLKSYPTAQSITQNSATIGISIDAANPHDPNTVGTATHGPDGRAEAVLADIKT